MTRDELYDVVGMCYYVPGEGFYEVMQPEDAGVWIRLVADYEGNRVQERENHTLEYEAFRDMTPEDFFEFADRLNYID